MKLKNITLTLLLATSASSTFCGVKEYVPTWKQTKEKSINLLRYGAYMGTTALVSLGVNALTNTLTNKYIGDSSEAPQSDAEARQVIRQHVRQGVNSLITLLTSYFATPVILRPLVKEPEEAKKVVLMTAITITLDSRAQEIIRELKATTSSKTT